MHMHRIGARAHKACSVWALIAGLGIATGMGSAFAQAQAPASTAGGDAPSEALRRQALSPYRFILQNANAPARAKPVAPPAEARKPAAAIEQASVARPTPNAAVTAIAAPAATPAAMPAPEPAPVASIAPSREPAPVAAIRREVIPIKTDEPHLPAALLRERPSGVVKVHFDINPDGSTAGVKVASSTNRSLNRVSVEAVTGWKFQPIDDVVSVETELVYKYE